MLRRITVEEYKKKGVAGDIATVVSVKVAHVLESGFRQLACFLFRVSNNSCEIVILEAYELRVQYRAVEGFAERAYRSAFFYHKNINFKLKVGVISNWGEAQFTTVGWLLL